MNTTQKPRSAIVRWGKKHRLAVVALAVAAAILIYLAVKPADPAQGLATAWAGIRDITTYNSFVGNVQPATERAVVAGASEQVIDVCVKEGDRVAAGDVLARLDTATA